MALINLKALGVTLGARLFSNLDLSVEAGDRVGIVAAMDAIDDIVLAPQQPGDPLRKVAVVFGQQDAQ